jgi:23S rRNA (cytosine1962-C5)-methyltransferase
VPVLPVRYHEGEVTLEVDLVRDQKTGGYLDQSSNHLLARRYGSGRALDCFTYHGGFALQLAKAGASVTAVDMSAPALQRASANAERNRVTIDWVEANVFDYLTERQNAGERFSTIVLDPPAFASGKQTEHAAIAAYKAINRRALQLLAPDGVLLTCSCSGRIRPADFDAMLVAAAGEARRSVHVVERRSAGPDHPVLVGVDETDYLKCRVLVVL